MSPAEPASSLPGDRRPSTSGTAPRRAAGEIRRRRRWPWVLVGVLVVIVGLAGWLGWKVLTVRDELTAAQAAVTAARDGGDLKAALVQVSDHAARSAEAAHDPLWGVAELVPQLGDNLRAARVSSEALDTLTGGLAVPALRALESDSADPMLVRLLPVLQDAAVEVGVLQDELTQVGQSPHLVSQLSSGIDQLTGLLGTVRPVVELLPGMLGAEGERNYLLVAQNNAETLALGGSAASQSLIRLADGKLTIAKQADSRQYQRSVPVETGIDQSAIDLYNEYLINNVNTSVGRPDWPTAATTIIALWNRDIDPEPVDGAISVDPLALARIMRATGPITVDGHELTSENVVSFLLSDAYRLYDGATEANDVFDQVAKAVMDSLVAGDFDLRELWTAVNESIDAGSILFWSADPTVQEWVAPLRVSGILPKSNQPTTTIGVYFRDASLGGSKIDYYLRSQAKVVSACEADGKVNYTVAVTVWLDLSKKQAEQLPAYVTSGDLATKDFRTQVFIYGPHGTEVTAEAREGARTWHWRPLDMHDLGRPTPSFMTYNPLGGEKATVQVTFTGPAEGNGPVEVRTTPMIRPTEVTVDDACTVTG